MTSALRFALPAIAAALFLVAPSQGARALAGDDEEPPAYGETPEDLVPFRGAGEPARRFFREAPVFRGPGRDAPEPKDVREVRIGLVAPYEGAEKHLGDRMRNGTVLAVEEANRSGGFREGVPFAIVERDEARAWAAAADALVDLAFAERVWGVVGALDDASSHVMTRVVLKTEVPIVNTAGPDPTLTEHMVPWVVRVRPDDRRTCYRLAKKVFVEDGRRRVAVFRANDRYARMGIREFTDAARRLGHPVAVEVRYTAAETSFERQIEHLRAARPDAIVMWGRADASGRALAALRAAGLTQPVYGPDRLADPVFVRAAGAAADGVVVTYPFDPGADRPAWRAFDAAYRSRFGEAPDAFAAYAYDGTRYLLDAIRTAGLNRPRILDALWARASIDGVTGPVRFDATHNNVSPVVVGRMAGGRFRAEE